MATAVKVDDEAKDQLEELQATIRLRTGTSVTQQELLSTIIEQGYASRDELVDSFRETSVPLSNEQKAAMDRGRISSGTETDEADVDEILYE